MAKDKKKSSWPLLGWLTKEKTSSTSARSKALIWGIIMVALAGFLILAAVDAAGLVGGVVARELFFLFGVGYWCLVALFFITAGLLFFRKSVSSSLTLKHSLNGLLLFASSLALIELLSNASGGLVGAEITSFLVMLFSFFGAAIILETIAVVTIIFLFDEFVDLHTEISVGKNFSIRDRFAKLFSRSKDKNKPQPAPEKISTSKEPAPAASGSQDDKSTKQTAASKNTTEDTKTTNQKSNDSSKTKTDDDAYAVKTYEKKDDTASVIQTKTHGDYTPPPLSILSRDGGNPEVGDVKARANLIKRTLENFNINVEMDEVSIGPTVTRYALKPAEGVRLSKITNLQNNLELALAAHPVRIEAPIPGKSLVGIEVPNESKTTVGLASLLGSNDFQDRDDPLLMSMGQGISGDSYFYDLNKMPHLLIGGATGAGKSVTAHALITSLLYRQGPDSLKMIMVDPKRVELTLYNGIPHLLTPVITSAKKAILALKWAAKEMDRRYDILEENQARDIKSYHENVLPKLKKQAGADDPDPEEMPYIVVVIDEMADLMQAYPKELESVIVRIAQMSRAVGIHLVLSTQRPDVNVITGLIKANVPARIALQVSSQIDSRTILDSKGAEQLLGAGDMLFQSGDMSQPVRIQSAFISEDEVKDVVKNLKKQYEDKLQDTVNLTEDDNDSKTIFDVAREEEEKEERDDKYEEALDTIVNAGKASTSYLQRKLRVGYSRAARIMDELEENGVISEKDGTKAREVLITKEQLEAARNGTLPKESEDEAADDNNETEETEHDQADEDADNEEYNQEATS